MMRVSVRFPRDHAAFARTFVDRSSRAARITFAVSATNITSWEKNSVRENLKNILLAVAQMLIFSVFTHLSQTREQDVNSQSPDSCRLHQIVLNVGQAQEHSDAHQLDFILFKKATHVELYDFFILTSKNLVIIWGETHRQLGEGLWQDGGECVAGACL